MPEQVAEATTATKAITPELESGTPNFWSLELSRNAFARLAKTLLLAGGTIGAAYATGFANEAGKLTANKVIPKVLPLLHRAVMMIDHWLKLVFGT